VSRLRALRLDFRTPSRLPTPWGAMVLGIGLLACTGVGFDYLAVVDDLAALQQRRESLARRSVRQPTGLPRATDSEATERAMSQVADAARQLRRPWDLLLHDMEGAVDDSVALLSIEPDVARQQLRITGEARQVDDALAFARRLEGSASLQRPTLTGHHLRQSDGGPVVVFTILTGWKES